MEGMIQSAGTEQIARDTFVVKQISAEGLAPVRTYINTMVITGDEPVIVDTGIALTRDSWMERTFSLVDPEDVRWIFLSHDDSDHTGNLIPVLEACPNATLITNWFTVERMAGDVLLPLDRMKWINDGDSFGDDNQFVTVLPPTFDSPTTRALFDVRSKVLWAADSFALPVPFEVPSIRDLPPGFFRESFLAAQRMVSPWHRWLDPKKYSKLLANVTALGAETVASCHGQALHGDEIDSAFELLHELPFHEGIQWPGAEELELMIKTVASMQPEAA